MNSDQRRAKGMISANRTSWRSRLRCQVLRVRCQRLNHSPYSSHDPRHFLEIEAVGCVKRSVVVGISEQSSVSNHDGRILFLPERPMVRPAHARPFGGGSSAFRRELSRVTKTANGLPHQSSRLLVSNKTNEVATIRIKEPQQSWVFLAARNIRIKTEHLK